MDHARYQILSFFGQCLVQTIIHTDNTTLTTNCGHNALVVVSDTYDLDKFTRVDMKSKTFCNVGGCMFGATSSEQHR